MYRTLRGPAANKHRMFAFLRLCDSTDPTRERRLKMTPKVVYAITTILGACAAAAHAADAAGAADAADSQASAGIQEVLVTAQRREESIQNVPITVQAIAGQQLTQLNISTFDDVIRYLPNVTFSTNGPGQGNIYMRGLSAGFAGSQSSVSIAPFTNVALYLDDQSMQFPARKPRLFKDMTDSRSGKLDHQMTIFG